MCYVSLYEPCCDFGRLCGGGSVTGGSSALVHRLSEFSSFRLPMRIITPRPKNAGLYYYIVKKFVAFR